MDALVAASAGPDAHDVLGAPLGAAAEIAQNVRVAELPTSPASSIYTGVLYDALGYATLSVGAKRKAHKALRVQSALWGPVGPNDRIAPYRLSMAVSLPGLGPVGAAWRKVLGPVMSEQAGNSPIIDCRSSTYASAWKPVGDQARQLVAVRVFTETNGQRTVVSHMAKHTRGLVARWLLESAKPIRRPADLVTVVEQYRPCELVDLGPRGWTLDVITPASTFALND